MSDSVFFICMLFAYLIPVILFLVLFFVIVRLLYNLGSRCGKRTN